jgi:hypothetical protein
MLFAASICIAQDHHGRGGISRKSKPAMRFDGGRWSVLGDADEVRKSDERRKIVAALKQAKDELSPKAIADLTGMKAVNVRVLPGNGS